MNVTQLNVIAEESCENIVAGQVVAMRSAGDKAWSDPYGGEFNGLEQASLNTLARGDDVTVRLRRVNGRSREFKARIAAKF